MIRMKVYKFNMFKDKKDYEKVLTNDNVINIIGTSGSGKTTTSLKYINDYNDYIIINCDKLLELPGSNENEDKELPIIRNMLKKKYKKIKVGKDFINCYNDIIDYIKKKNKKILIEGNLILGIDPITQLKGKVIVKRTGIIKSYVRAVKRDYPNEYFMKMEIEKYGKLGKITRLFKIANRRKNIFKQRKDLEKKIKELEALKN